MADDLRGPKFRRRLYIANPDPDDPSEDRDYDPPTTITHGYHHDANATNFYGGWYPGSVYAATRPSPSTPSRYIPPLSTVNLTTMQSNSHSHPGLSPSNTSSPAAEESTPPPSTPGLPPQSNDPVNNDIPQQDPQGTERSSSESLICRAGKIPRNITSAPQQHAKGPRPADTYIRRPRPSPTVPTQDASTPTINSANSSLSISSDKSDVNKLLIVVTADSERYVTVDITGAKNAAVIRECIFSKLKICQDEEQSQYSIYKTEIGDFAIGDALTDEQLFGLCRDRGDNKGSLKFLISHKNAVVHQEPSRPYTPVIPSIPPPVLPNFPPSPVRIKARSRSRHGSASSVSEPHTAEATGYEADLDNGDKEKDSHKPVRHQQQPSHSNQVSPPPPALRKVSNPPVRPNSPAKTSSSPPISSERHRPQEETDAPSISLPSISPLRPNFPILEDATSLPLLPSHIRTGSDGTEHILKPSESYQDTKLAKQRMAPPLPPPPGPAYKTRSGSPREELSSTAKEARSRVEETKQDTDEWTLIPHPGEMEFGTFSQESRTSPTVSRSHRQQHGSPVRYVPQTPYSSSRVKSIRPPISIPTSLRPAAVPIPANYLVSWKVEDGGNRKNGLVSPSSATSRLSKGAKSMDNLRAGSSYPGPGSYQQSQYKRNPLPVSHARENNYYNGVVTPSVPKSYESSRQSRPPLPTHMSTNSTPPDLNQHGYRSPYSTFSLATRPQSAHADSPTSPSSSQPQYSNDLSDNSRLSHAILSHNPTHVSIPSRQHYSDRQSDTYSSSEASRSTPPRSPASPLSPPYPSHSEGSTSNVPSKLGILNEDELSASTVKQEDRGKMATLINISNNSESTLIASRLLEIDNPPSPGSSTTATTVTTPSSPYAADDDDFGSEFGTMIWKKRPEPKSPMRPQLTVQIATPKTDVSTSSTVREQLHRPSISRVSKEEADREDKKSRGNTFIERSDLTWAPRPPPEDVYDRLEEFFPEHDLDKPVIEAGSGSTSPTAAEAAATLAPPSQVADVPEKKGIVRARKSIRYVAEDFKKRIDRKSTNAATSHSNLLRKRNTKLWGSKVEEVTTAQARTSSVASETSPSSAPTFKWIRGELIGKGTYGRVYLAMNANTGEMMAVKQVESPQTASDRNDSRQASMVQALKLESETLKDLDHPNIVQYLGFEETPTNLSIFLEYVPGGSVGSCLLKHGRFDENVVKSFTHQILDGLHYLHSKGILHRDLKADNILVEMSGVCKISDFGISKRTDDIGGGAFTAMQGTVFWMAPEVINTQKKGYNFKVDIWSVGCVVLEMWAGKRPWTGEEMVAVMFKLYQSKLPPPVPDDVSLSELADDFRMRCFAINPEERATAVELMAHPYLKLPPEWQFSKFT